jgi:PKD repeat protein
MSRMFASVMILAIVTLLAACTKEQEKPAAKATPEAKAAAPAPAAPQAQPSGSDDVDELYVDLDADPDEGAPPLTVKFTSTIEDATPPLTYKWDFGDGSPPGTEANPTHVYQKAGEFTATLNVKDSKGISGSEEVDILVEADQ